MRADPPHAGVWARLGASRRHGVGVFAIVPIPAGTSVFANDSGALVWIDAADIDVSTGDEHRRLYHDFGVQRGPLLGCPANFNMLSVGWYVNEPSPGVPPNLGIGEDLAMVSVRDIAAGEELSITYSTFSGETRDVGAAGAGLPHEISGATP